MIDHVYVFCRPGAPEIERLLALGAAVGREAEHPGQGTANRCIELDGAMLELIWVREPPGPLHPEAERLRLSVRAGWRDNGSNPFGVCLLPFDGEVPFPSWPYRPPYLPPGVAMPVSTASDSAWEPMLFTLPAGAARRGRPDRAHRLSERRLASVELALPDAVLANASEGLRWLGGVEGVELTVGSTPHMTLTLGPQLDGRTHDLGPELPLTLRI